MPSEITDKQNREPATVFRLGHRPALDGLRGIFVALVLAVHSGVPFMQGAGLGVDGFFALSGFLITSLLLQEWQQRGSISLRRFYIRRALRLLPALYAMLALVSVVTIVSLEGEGAVATWRGIVLSFLYVSNWATVVFPDFSIGVGLMSHSWSLALEEQFYVLWPIVLVSLLSIRVIGKRLALCTAILVIASPLLRLWLVNSGSPELFFLAMDTRTDAILAGCTLGVLAAGGMILPSARAAKLTRWLALAAIGVLIYLVIDPTWIQNLLTHHLVFTLVAVCATALILHLIVSPQGRMAGLLSWKPLVQLGVVSYGVYLWHNPVFHLLPLGADGWLNLPVQLTRLAVTALFVVLSYRYLEKPILRIKERFSGRPDVTQPAVVPGYAPQSL